MVKLPFEDDECYKRRDTRRLRVPKKRLHLPFFAYDVFKPGQIAYSRIKDFVYEEPTIYNVPYSLSTVNGIPFVFKNRYLNYSTTGYLIRFNYEDAFDAYKVISDAKSYKRYKWSTIKDWNFKINILVARNDLIDLKFNENAYEYDGRNDPMLIQSIDTISRNFFEIYNQPFSFDNFFNLQMNYILLWSSIDRYLDLKFGKTKQSINLSCLANEESFKIAVFEYADKNDVKPKVFSNEDLRSFELNKNKPLCCIKYYYTIRCNVVHTGKSNRNDYSLLKRALCELLLIYIYVLRDAFNDYNLFEDIRFYLKNIWNSF